MRSLDVKAAFKNGVIQLISGTVAIIFGMAAAGYTDKIFYDSFSLWSGIGSVKCGALMLLSIYKQRSAGTGGGIGGVVACVITLILSVSATLLSIAHFSVIFFVIFMGKDEWHCFPGCDDAPARVVIFLSSVLAMAAFVQVFSAVWAMVITSKALHYHRLKRAYAGIEEMAASNNAGDSSSSSLDTINAHRNAHAESSSSLKYNVISQFSATVVSSFANVVILLIVAEFRNVGIGSSDHDQLVLPLLGSLTSAGSLWCAPCYLLVAYSGFRAWKYGENSSLVTFLTLNCGQIFLSLFCEFMPTLAVLIFTNEYEGWHYEVDPDGDTQFRPTLVAFLSFIVISALLHFAFSIWGIAAAAINLARDFGCCGNCCCCGDCGCCVDGGGSDEACTPYVVMTPPVNQSEIA